LFRHGNRVTQESLLEYYPSDPYKYLGGSGKLTNVRSDVFIRHSVDTLHRFVNLIIIKTVSYVIKF